MKKIACTLLIAVMFVFLTSCKSTQPDLPENVIMPSALTAEQQDIVDLLSILNTQEVMIFDYHTVEAYKSLEVWVEVYQNGAIVDRPAGVGTHSDTAEKLSGHLAISINRNDTNYQWLLSVIENGGKLSHIATTEAPADSGLARAFGPITEPVEIEDGKEIVLYSSVFSGNDFLVFYDGVSLQERPELINEYPYVYLVKIMFDK